MAKESVLQINKPLIQDPAFVTYLFSPEVDHDCYFVVGDKTLVQPERIGVVKKMLLAHSAVFRLELQDSKLAEKGDVPLEDLYPDTFRNLLRFTYGHDNSHALTFDEADDLLYAAEKYMMSKLKDRLATRLMALLNTDNICSLLNNPACFTVIELDSAITKILQHETDLVFASSDFLSLSPDAFVKILQQEAMNVREIEVWRAAIEWAKEKASSEDGKELRKQLVNPLKHLHLCTLSSDELSVEVVNSGVLNIDEFKLCALACEKKERQDGLVGISNEIIPRQRSYQSLSFKNHGEIATGYGYNTIFFIGTRKSNVELLPWKLLGDPASWGHRGLKYRCDCTVEITRITDRDRNTSTEAPLIVKFSEEVEYDKEFEMPLVHDGKPVILQQYQKYELSVTFSNGQKMFNGRPKRNFYRNLHMFVSGSVVRIGGRNNYSFLIPMSSLKYIPLRSKGSNAT